MKTIYTFKYTIIGFSLFFSLLLKLQAQAQTAKIIKGAPHKMSMKSGWAEIDAIGHDAKGHYYLLYPFSKVYSGNYVGSKAAYIGMASPTDMKLARFEKLELTFEKNELELEFGFDIGGVSYVFSSFQNNKQQKTFLFAHVVDRTNLIVKGNPIPVAEIDFSSFSKYKRASFSYRLSPDRSKVLFTHNLLDKDGSLLASGHTVVNQQLKALDRSSGMEFDEVGVYQFQDYFLSNSGTVFLLTKYFDKNKDYRTNIKLKKQAVLSSTRFWEEEANFDYKIIKMGKGGSVQKTLTLALPAAFITQVDIATKDDGGLICLGFYSDNEDAIPDGAFSQDVNNQMTVISTDRKSLDDKFVQPLKYVNDTYKGRGLFDKKDDLSNYRFTLKRIIKKQNGGYTLAAERNATLTRTVNNGKTISTFNVYHTDDIVLLDVTGKGKINWIKQIEKSQETSGMVTLFASFGFEEHNNNLILFFTDFTQENLKGFGKVVDTESVMVIVKPDGTLNKQVIFKAATDELTIKAEKTAKVSNGNFVLYGHNGMFLVGFCKVVL